MNILTIFGRYMARQFVFWFLAMLIALLVIILFAEMTELLRRAADKPQVTFNIIFKMAVLKLPVTGEKVLPFVTLFAGMYCFARLTRTQELVVARASGISAWQFLTPVVAATIMLALVNLAIINPVGAMMTAKFHQMEDRYLGHGNMLDISSAGLWLRQIDDERQILLHADKVTKGEPLSVTNVMVLMFDSAGHYTGRIDAASGELESEYWEMTDAWINRPGHLPEHASTYILPTGMTVNQIQQSLASPDTLSIWNLPAFIATLKSMGFSSLHHEIYLWSELLQPVLLSAMILFAAAFSLRHNRRGGVLILIGAGVITGFLVYAANSVILALGQNETLPILVAAGAIPLLSWLIGGAILLNLEDG